jgi:hypothetical protein
VAYTRVVRGYFFTGLVLVLSMGAAACGGGGSASPRTATVADVPTAGVIAASPVASATAVVARGHSGIAVVDAAIDAVVAGDVDAVQRLVRYTPTACDAHPRGIGGPPACRAGEADKTLVDVIAAVQCEGFFVRSGEFDARSIVAANSRLYAVYRASAGSFPAGDYVVIFAHPAAAPGSQAEAAYALMVSDSGVVGVHYGCSQTPAEFVKLERLTDAVVAP